MNPSHIVMFSGGVSSWAAAKRVVERFSTDGVVLLFADTRIEDYDLYRFLDEAALNVGVAVTRISDGRNPWEVMRDERIIGNSRFDPCSKILKRQLLAKWRDEHASPETTVCYLGLDWTEEHRLTRLQSLVAPWRYDSPLLWLPQIDKVDVHNWLKREGITPPRLYEMGFPHNNCGGFCIKAGQAQFALLLRTMPERYAYHEAQEEKMREMVGDHSIMRDRRGGASKPLSMRDFRLRIEAQETFDKHEWGGCGCAIDDEAAHQDR